jgi:hypothetical protein
MHVAVQVLIKSNMAATISHGIASSVLRSFDKSSTTGYQYIDERERELANVAHHLEYLKLK